MTTDKKTSRRELSLEELNEVNAGFFLTGLAVMGISTGIGLIIVGAGGMTLDP